MAKLQTTDVSEVNRKYFQEEVTAHMLKSTTQRRGCKDTFSVEYYYNFEYGPNPPEGGKRFELNMSGSFKSESEMHDHIVSRFQEYVRQHDFSVKLKFSIKETYTKIESVERKISEEEIKRIQTSLEGRLK